MDDEAGPEGFDVRYAVHVDRIHFNRVQGSAEIITTFHRAERSHIGRCRFYPLGTDGEDPRRAESRGGSRGERADQRRRRAVTEIIKGQTFLGIISVIIKDTAAVDRDDVARGHDAGTSRGEGGIIDDQALGDVRGQWDVARGCDRQRTLLNRRTAGIGIRGGKSQSG